MINFSNIKSFNISQCNKICIFVSSNYSIYQDMYAKTARFFTIIFLLLSFVGCIKDNAQNTSRLRVKLSNVPTDIFEEFHIDIAKIEVSHSNASDNSDNNYTELDFNGIDCDISNLSNGRSLQILDQFFAIGAINRIKIFFGTNNYLQTTSGISEIVVPEDIQKNGFAVDVNLTLLPNVISYLILEINTSQSVYKNGDEYILRPVIRAFSETFGGSLRGYALPAEAEPTVTIIRDEDTLFTIPDEANGMFMFKGLNEGIWEIKVASHSLTDYLDTVFTDTIFAGQLRDIKTKIVLKKNE